jgi:hypothetical protein
VGTDGRADGIAARPLECEAATLGWLERTVQSLMLARVPFTLSSGPSDLTA